MKKGDLVEFNINGKTVTVCIVGFYTDDDSGQEYALLVEVPPDSIMHISLDKLAGALNLDRMWN
ncbi:MAG: hypothetical protein ACM3NT_08350 [Methylocystaceae bacterium]